MADARSVSTPIGAHFKLQAVKEDQEGLESLHMRDVSYYNAVGSIMYMMVSTRPDITYGLGLVSRFMSKPSREHWKAIQWLLRYLKGTKQLKLQYSKHAALSTYEVTGYCDSDYVADLDKRMSISGYVFAFGGNIVSWKSNLQNVVALSTTEAEYISLTEAVKEGLWISGFVTEMGFDQSSISIFCDSQSAIHLSKNLVFHERTKHIEVRLHFVRDIVSKGLAKVLEIDAQVNPADILTKVVPVNKLNQALSLLKLVE
ncbi:secreted RxLR effector protein 161-like [Henckelia pumila]|uniref:secreted RxLR effector protein 161-like n=1 Tax=Henckelia pumila TaxID=405737 RepID=UPI003C6DF1CC